MYRILVHNISQIIEVLLTLFCIMKCTCKIVVNVNFFLQIMSVVLYSVVIYKTAVYIFCYILTMLSVSK